MNSLKENNTFQVINFDEDIQNQQQTNQPKYNNVRPQQIQINSLSAYNKHAQSISNGALMKNQSSMDQSELLFYSNQKEKINLYKNTLDNQHYVEFEEQDSSPQKLRVKDKNPLSQKISLMRPSQNLYQKVYSQLDKIYQSLTRGSFSFSVLQNFLHSPLPPLLDVNYMRYVFQIHSYNFQFTFHTYYEFYLRNSQGEMVNIMRAQKQSLTVSSSIQIYAINVNDTKNKQFTAKLKYNTLKSEYNLYDIDEKVHEKAPRNILATVLYDKAFNQSRQLIMYKPKQQYRIKGEFVKSLVLKNLSQLYDTEQTPLSRKLQKLKTVLIDKNDQETVREEFQLKKQGRKILLQNQQDMQKFYMGKKQDGRYIILAGNGLTPLQIFMSAIVNLEH